MEQSQESLKNERKQTDNSLSEERGKTDASFKTGRRDTYDNTDEIVSKDREEADADRLQQRSDADISNKPGFKVDAALADQRKSEDEAIESERLNMDKALEFERKEKAELLNKLVNLERQATDKNLLDERTKTDLVAQRTVGLLTAEHAEHQKTKSALTTREEFVAIVSHDLRNPIGAILSSTEILLEDSFADELTTEAKTLIHIIKRSAETSLRLISDILDMERIVEGKLQLQLTKNKIDVLIQESLESYIHTASTKKILLQMNPSNTAVIECDKDRVAQILSNLIGNALKFTPENGSVTVESTETENEIIVSVCDTGPGIPEDQKHKIFERFAQLSNKQRSGIGLGLYIAKTLVESHLGKIWVTSTLGSGSTFWFTLPKQSC
jgi:signal transduction histidine kinase